MSTKSSSNIVLVGAGLGGFQLFRDLAAKLANTRYNLIVVDPRQFVVHLPSTIRMVVTPEGGYENKSIMDHPSDLSSGNVRFVYAEVTSIEDDGSNGGRVVLNNGEFVDYSILILATGSRWAGPMTFGTTKSQILESVNSWRTKFAEAQDIVFVGGGAIGLELSGEIKDMWPQKQVTIVHGQRFPLNSTYPDRWRKNVAQKFIKRGIQLVLSDYVENLEPKDGKIVTRSGKSIPADLVVPTFGPLPNTEFIKSLGSDVLTDKGYVKVNPTLQLVDHPRIFALGDIIDWKEEKQAAKVGGHLSIVSNNALTLLGLKPGFKSYKGSIEMIGLSNGKNGGSSYFDVLWGIFFGDWFTRLLKSRSLMVDMTRGSLGFPPSEKI